MDHFSLEENGYNRSEVNTFLSNVIKQTNDLIEKCKVQTEEIERLKKDLIIYKDRENSINEIISKAEIECDNLRQKARDEREIIINDVIDINSELKFGNDIVGNIEFNNINENEESDNKSKSEYSDVNNKNI